MSCIKPISIPDRWDDVTPIPGYTGGSKKPNWAGNGRYDFESFTDLNANHLWDPGEPYTDSNGNGAYDREAYDPVTTGYNADANAANGLAPAGDLGLEFVLQPPGASAPTIGQYYAIDLPAINRGTPVTGGSQYQDNFASCNPSVVGRGDRIMIEPGGTTGPTNQAMRDLIAQDPNAYWDATTSSVQGSAFPAGGSPRILRFAKHDPRIPLSSGTANALVVTGVLAFFMEQMTGNAAVQGRLLRTPGLGETCTGGATNGGFVIACATPATPTSWGRIKGTYR
ncbi:MAG: hypothetical protein ABI960_06860 [Candidatus Eisenbacteria bacterium]